MDSFVPVDSILSSGDLLYLELGITIQIIGTPGHSREPLCFYYKEEKILFTGDVIPDPPDAPICENSRASEATLGCLEGLEEVDLCCSTWDKVYDRRTGMHMVHSGRSRISKTKEYTEACRGRIQEKSPQGLFGSICEESNMAEYKESPVFMRSIIPDLGQLDQENHRG